MTPSQTPDPISTLIHDAICCHSAAMSSGNKLALLRRLWDWDKTTAISQTTLSNAFSWMQNVWISIKKIHWSLFLRVNIPPLVQRMTWRRSRDKPLSEPMMFSSLTHICVTRPPWVKNCTQISILNIQFLNLNSSSRRRSPLKTSPVFGWIRSVMTNTAPQKPQWFGNILHGFSSAWISIQVRSRADLHCWCIPGKTARIPWVHSVVRGWCHV